MPVPTAPTAYSERLHVPPTWWVLGALFVVSVGWVFWVATSLAATLVATTVAAALMVWGLTSFGRLRVAVDGAALYAGRAVLPRDAIGSVEVLDADEARRTLGPGADARAFLVTRPYCRSAVKVEVSDVGDPTPYWIVSTRDPERLASSLLHPSVGD